jgi:hypothetical protein
MAEIKNSFIKSKMNKDLDDRLIPNGEYRNAVNVSINKSTGENVGTAQTVLGNKLIKSIDPLLSKTGLQFIGALPDDTNNIIYAFLTNNILEPYVANGSVGNNQTYPDNQDTSVGGPISITAAGSTYTTEITGETTNITVANPNANGLTVGITVNGTGQVTSATIISFGAGYTDGDVVQINGGNNAARLTIESILPSDSVIISYNIDSGNVTTLVDGPFLNFSTLYPITGINLLEELLFFTDNRNQPRKININRDSTYYTTEDQISVAKYYPYETIQLYQPSQASGAIFATADLSSAVNNSNILPLTSATPTAPSNGDGVIGTNATLVNAGLSYTTGSYGTTGGLGSGLIINVTSVGGSGEITGFTITATGRGYVNGETITVIGATGNNAATLLINVVNSNTFIVSENWPTDVTVNQNLTLPTGTALSFVEAETTMQDAISEYLPVEANSDIDTITSPTDFNLTLSNYVGEVDVVGLNVFLENSSGNFVDTGSTVTAFNKVAASNYIQIQCNPGITSPDYVIGTNVKLALANPYFDNIFKDNANVDFLEDKFVRFSYRFRFDDGEYSLIAPFTQPCFIPKQDGYFRNTEFGASDEELTDEEKAYRSTEVGFMENKVNKILLNVPLPSSANDLNNVLKVVELDILYKESDQTTIKVVESIPLENNVYGESPYYQYEYGSKPPFKVLPQKETTRVSDKIPVKAVSQEVVSNRVIYGNFQDKHTPPKFLDYTLGAGAKEEEFFISKNIVNNYTSIVEYPNAGLKQNRNYEVGVVLSDRFGRQSTVIFSKSRLGGQSSFLASSIFTQFRSLEDNQSSSSNPTNGIPYFDGDSLKIQFNDFVSSIKNPTTGTPGLYNGDPNSASYNPLGWYSFKIVVKQTEQEYYNIYVPTAMAAYPLERDKEVDNTSHIVLYNDNINKIPRDLTEVGPTQREFRSSVRLFPKVANNPPTGTPGLLLNYQYYTGRTPDITTTIATIKDLFNYEDFPAIVTGEYVFYNFEYDTSAPGQEKFPDASSLVARINTNKQFGVQVPTPSGFYTSAPKLNVLETEPVVSLLDIYYETSTTGRIDLLNKAIDEGPPPNAFDRIQGGAWKLNEGMRGLNASPVTDLDIDVTAPFKPVRLDGSDFTNPAQNSCNLISVTNQIGGGSNPSTENQEGIPYYNSSNEASGIFKVIPTNAASPNGFFKIVLCLDPATTPVNSVPGLVVTDNILDHTYTFNLEFDNPESGAPLIEEITGALGNIQPDPPLITIPRLALTVPCGGPLVIITSSTFDVDEDYGPLFKLQSENGSSTQALDQLNLDFQIQNLAQFNTGTGVYDTISPAGKFFIDPNASAPTFGTGVAVSVPQNNTLQSNVGYRLTILVTDGGGLQNTCTIFFEFSQAPSILWWAPANSYAIISGSSSSSPNRFLDVLQNATWIKNFNPPNPTLPAPNNGFNSNISFGTVRLSNDADVTMTAEFRALDDDPAKSELLGFVRVEHKFSETGNFVSPDYTLVVVGAGVSTNTSPTFTAAIPFTMPAGWGLSTPNNAYNVQTEVTYSNLGPFTGNPYIQFYLKAIP